MTYNEEIAHEILKTISCSEVGIRKLCKMYSHWPNANTIMEWKISHPEFGERYARAKQQQIELIVDEIIEIADDSSGDTITKKNKKGEEYEACDNEWVQRSRLRIDTRKWLAAKLLPKLYGDKIQIEKNDSSDPDLERAKLIAAEIVSKENGRSKSTQD